ncbi:hypothetical protein TorRG33x02_002140 [Trema orientale]|uniref:RNase H type-1 domain-containing protein n=1 Tax=Trema orientale TaxID=63057 RepID=A0A2P5G1I5_TREOI|nr:hypothetical protein TorRG33x02_002140 [Trema orientale]
MDTALGAGHNYIGVGAVIRDSLGSVRAALSKKIVSIFSPFLAECINIREGIMLAVEYNLPISFIKSDSRNAILVVQNGFLYSLKGPILKDIYSSFYLLGNVTCYHISRLGNMVAHNLAHFRFRSRIDQVWVDETPTCVHCYVLNDLLV